MSVANGNSAKSISGLLNRKKINNNFANRLIVLSRKKFQPLSGYTFSYVEICCFSLFYIIVNSIFLYSGLLLEQNNQFEDFT